MSEYHKIHSLYKRDRENNNRFTIGDYARPEFELLSDIKWQWSEKIDGTNIRVIFDGESIEFRGRTDRADIPKPLLQRLGELFSIEKMKEVFLSADKENPVILYGEGYGGKIQSGGRYKAEQDFILFDIFINVFLLSSDVQEIGQSLGLKVVPIIGYGTINESIEFVKAGFTSLIAEDKTLVAEGLIIKPVGELRDRRGSRIITKIKIVDFKE